MSPNPEIVEGVLESSEAPSCLGAGFYVVFGASGGRSNFCIVNVRSPTTGNSGCSVQFMMTSMVTSSFSTCKVVGLDPPCKPGPSDL